jgi:zinc protease
MSMPKTTISLTFNADMEVTLENMLSFSFLQQIMRQRYTTSIREERGGTYSVGCGGGFTRRPVEAVRFIVQFDTNKDLAAELIQVVKDELKKMAEEGPTADEINTIKEYMVKQHLDNIKNNSAWSGTLNNLHVDGADLFTGYQEIVEGMNAEQIKALASKIINSGNSALVVMNAEE